MDAGQVDQLPAQPGIVVLVLLKSLFHARRRPKKVDRRGAGGGDGANDGRELFLQESGLLRSGIVLQFRHAQGDAVGGGDADGRGAADDHAADAFGHLKVAAVGDELFFSGQQALVEHDHGAVLPFDDRMHWIFSLIIGRQYYIG